MSSPREIELKLRLDPSDLETFASALGRSKAKQMRLKAIYYDDRKWKLARHGLEVRVRAQGGEHVQTVKAGSGFERGEWEDHVADGRPSMRKLRRTPAAKALSKKHRLRPVFATEVERRTWVVKRQGATVEISLDSGVIISGSRTESIAEAEFELKEGSPDAVFSLAQEATERCDAPLSFVGKALRGRRIAQGVMRRAERDLDLRLPPDASVNDAFEAIMMACLQQMSLNEEILRADPGSEEGVHQMRVAVRRLRAALTVFNRLTETELSHRVNDELKWISDLLGEVRDFDVLTSKLLRRACLAHPDVGGVAELRANCEMSRRGAHLRLNAVLHSVRFRRFLLSLAQLTFAGDWRADERRRDLRAELFRDFAVEELNGRLKAVRAKKSADKVRGTDEMVRHKLRIRAKKLRYMGEFLEPVVGARSARSVLKQLNALQNSLGTIHDAVAAEQLLASLVARDPKLAFAAALVLRTVKRPAACRDDAIAAIRKLRKGGGFGS